MPFTPYHFGPSGFVGLVFRKWIDVPVFVLANVVIDFEVLAISAMGYRWPYHRYMHTMLIGALVGAVFGAAAWYLRGVFKWGQELFGVPYRTNRVKMVASGAMGAAFHVLVDGVYHFDVMAFWPWKHRPATPLFGLVSGVQVKYFCVLFWFLAILAWGLILMKKHARPEDSQLDSIQAAPEG